MTRAQLLDSSCVLAWLLEESGSSEVEPILPSAYITAVNMAEVVTKVERLSGQGQACAEDLVEAGLTVVPVGWREIAAVAAVRRTERASALESTLSLGDVTCISYAIVQDMTIITADRAWANLELPVPVELIR